MPRANSEPTRSAVTSPAAAEQSAVAASPESSQESTAPDASLADAIAAAPTAAPAAEPFVQDGNVVELTEVKVLITRDVACKIPKTVFKHELPALRLIHTPDNVLVISERPVKVAGFDVATEFLRLGRKYDRKNFEVTTRVYGLEGEKLEALTGVRRGPASGTEAAASLTKIRPSATETVRVYAA